MGGALHTDLAAGRWQSLTPMEQLANIGSEVERAIRAHEAGKTERRDRAVDRALDLFDLTAAIWRGARLKELLRARAFFCGLFFDSFDAADAAALMRYFYYFAVAARRSA